VPVAARAIDRAIDLNGVAVAFNRQAFAWGRRAAVDLATVERIARVGVHATEQTLDLDALISRRASFLTEYQDARWADRYRAFVARVRAAERAAANTSDGDELPLTTAVAESLFKLMSYKDEYEVARLYTNGAFAAKIAEQFEGDFRLRFHLAPPILAPRDPLTGHLRKVSFGPWMLGAFRMLARCKRLRGTRFDPFGYTAERKLERALIAEYRSTVEGLLERLSESNRGIAIGIARLPLSVRGFGHVKESAAEWARRRQDDLLARYRGERSESPVRIVEPA
jgi:indolepyruvate ferredoxin oxidoreductase